MRGRRGRTGAPPTRRLTRPTFAPPHVTVTTAPPALLEQVAAATRQRKSHVALAFSAVIFVMVFLGIGAGFLWWVASPAVSDASPSP